MFVDIALKLPFSVFITFLLDLLSLFLFLSKRWAWGEQRLSDSCYFKAFTYFTFWIEKWEAKGGSGSLVSILTRRQRILFKEGPPREWTVVYLRLSTGEENKTRKLFRPTGPRSSRAWVVRLEFLMTWTGLTHDWVLQKTIKKVKAILRVGCFSENKSFFYSDPVLYIWRAIPREPLLLFDGRDEPVCQSALLGAFGVSSSRAWGDE